MQKLLSQMMYMFLDGNFSEVSLGLHTSSNCGLPEGQVLANVFIQSFNKPLLDASTSSLPGNVDQAE